MRLSASTGQRELYFQGKAFMFSGDACYRGFTVFLLGRVSMEVAVLV